MKTIALYLPQFHRTKQNDEWWGEGFTDWVSAKNAKPLFQGHYQPHEPLNDNYYNLLDKNTMKWQAELAKKYGVSGFCFYHYWFMNGKTVLEKPAENLLEWKEIDTEFCFSWDSTPWAKTWSRVARSSSWVTPMEDANKVLAANDTGMLVDQKYGREDCWRKHFEYLLPFFKDSRYIKKDEKPVFIFYSANIIYCLDEMVMYWQSLAKREGLAGIYTIAVNCKGRTFDYIDAYLVQEPGSLLNEIISEDACETIEGNKLVDYELLWNKILSVEYSYRKTYYGGIVGFDNTARKKPAIVVSGANPKIFESKLVDLYRKNHAANNEFTFINAWNEWGEGTHLEPDKIYKYAYLEATRNAQNTFENEDKAWINGNKIVECDERASQLSKMSEYFALMNEWMFKLEDNKSVAAYFINNNFKKIAIYGYGHLAKHLLFQLQGHDVKVEYIIEQNKTQNSVPYPVKTLNDGLEHVDAVVVTPFLEYVQIKKAVKEQLRCPIISIKEVVMEI